MERRSVMVTTNKLSEADVEAIRTDYYSVPFGARPNRESQLWVRNTAAQYGVSKTCVRKLLGDFGTWKPGVERNFTHPAPLPERPPHIRPTTLKGRF